MTWVRRHLARSAAVALFLLAAASAADAGAILPGFNASTLPVNDDESTGPVGIGFDINFFGAMYSDLYINNNGNVTFTGPMWTYTPFPLLTTATPIIAPFFADVDTRFAGDAVTYGPGTVNGHDAFGVNWIRVNYYSAYSPEQTNRNAFQFVMIDRSDREAGDFDFWFNYDYIQWEAGEASGSTRQGCGGTSARAGWSNGSNASFELLGSAVNGAFIDSGNCPGVPGVNALALNRLNSTTLGRYEFTVRNGVAEPAAPPAVPEPATLLLLGTGLVAAAGRAWRKPRR